jgi:hypothetical protein
MAIQISGTTVVNNSRQLQNIASLDCYNSGYNRQQLLVVAVAHAFHRLLPHLEHLHLC